MQFSLLAEGLFELLGPILIFGIYIIASIVKTVSKKGQKDDPDEKLEPELKKAVRRSYQEIFQKQVPKAQPKASQSQQPKLHVQSQPVQKPSPAHAMRDSQWEIQQEMIRQRNAKLQSRKIASKPVPAYVSTVASQPQIKPMVYEKTANSGVGIPKQTENQLMSSIKGFENLRSAIILKEILDKPLALRDDSF